MNTFYGCRKEGNICDKRESCRRYTECEEDASTTLWKMACKNYELFMKVEEINADSSVRKDSVGKDTGEEHAEEGGVQSNSDVHDETTEDGRD